MGEVEVAVKAEGELARGLLARPGDGAAAYESDVMDAALDAIANLNKLAPADDGVTHIALQQEDGIELEVGLRVGNDVPCRCEEGREHGLHAQCVEALALEQQVQGGGDGGGKEAHGDGAQEDVAQLKKKEVSVERVAVEVDRQPLGGILRRPLEQWVGVRAAEVVKVALMLAEAWRAAQVGNVLTILVRHRLLHRREQHVFCNRLTSRRASRCKELGLLLGVEEVLSRCRTSRLLRSNALVEPLKFDTAERSTRPAPILVSPIVWSQIEVDEKSRAERKLHKENVPAEAKRFAEAETGVVLFLCARHEEVRCDGSIDQPLHHAKHGENAFVGRTRDSPPTKFVGAESKCTFACEKVSTS